MAFDRIQPPDMWQSAMCQMLYTLVCAWSNGKPPKYADFFPRTKQPTQRMDDAAILAAFGIKHEA